MGRKETNSYLGLASSVNPKPQNEASFDEHLSSALLRISHYLGGSIAWHRVGPWVPSDLVPSLVVELFPPLLFVYYLWAHFWDLQLCGLSQSIWINFARSRFDLQEMVQIKSSCDLFIHCLCNSIEKLSCLRAVISAFFSFFFFLNPWSYVAS